MDAGRPSPSAVGAADKVHDRVRRWTWGYFYFFIGSGLYRIAQTNMRLYDLWVDLSSDPLQTGGA